MKKIIVLLGSIVIGTALFAQAPELKNVMPNSWEKLTRLSEQEEKEFLADNVIKQDLEERKNYYDKKKNKEVDVRVYSENCNGLNFYRILYCNEALDTFLNTEYKNSTITQKEYEYIQDIEMLQSLFIKEKNKNLRFIGGTSYHEYWVSQGEWEGFNFSDIMIKSLNKNEIGFFVTEAIVSLTINRMNVVYRTVKNQQVGFSRAYFRKYNIKDEINTVINNDSIEINASDYLFDSKCPLKYSIQNAFDGNPATSYVENTEDDLMKLVIRGISIRKDIQVKFAIINGYASNAILYNLNNRIKLCGLKNSENAPFLINLNDNNMEFQIKTINRNSEAYFGMFEFITTDIFPGSKYNDSCIGELNFFDNKNNEWIFGEINE